jgi:undecaprenyl pyrophosphate phosphatase UppP
MSALVARLSWPHLALLLAGDALVFILFALLGMRMHEGLSAGWVIWRTSVPLMAGWFAVGLLMGAFRDDAFRPLHLVWLKTLLFWLPAGVVGLLLRTTFFDRDLVLSFSIVALIVGGLLLAAWRTLFSLLVRRSVPAGP